MLHTHHPIGAMNGTGGLDEQVMEVAFHWKKLLCRDDAEAYVLREPG